MNTHKEILIIGAGSTGLSAALFLAEAGYRPQIIDKRTGPATITKALGVNANTMQLLESSGVTARFLQNGWKAACFNFWCRNRIVYKNELSKVRHPYPFMLVQPQYQTEAILEEALAERGIYVQRDLELDSLVMLDDAAEVSLRDKHGLVSATRHMDIVIGADGHKSKVRECTNTDFKGWEHHEVFTMYDVELDTPISPNEGHYHFFKEGGMLMLHIRDGVWRVGGNMKDVFNFLPAGTKTGKISWETTFTIREKVAARFSTGNVYLLGDAAHIHSPAGARGMNLCIEDSYIFTQLLKENRQSEFNALRRPPIKRAVSILSQLTDKVGGHNFLGNTIRQNMDKLAVFFPLVMPRFRKFILGIK